MEKDDQHFIDLPTSDAASKVLKWNERIAAGLTAHPRSTTYVIGKPKNESNAALVGIYLRKNPLVG